MPRTAAAGHDAALPSDPHPRSARGTICVIGNGMVGYRFCRRLVERGAAGRYRIVALGEEAQPAYDRVRLTDLFTGCAAGELLLAPARWYADHGIELRLSDAAVAIDRTTRTVTCASGFEVPYTWLVLATGSLSYVPPIEGSGLPGVFVYRTLSDVAAIKMHASRARAAAVIGGGLLGLEAARALREAGLQTMVIEAASTPMASQLDQEAGDELERQVAALGIRVLTATRTRRIERAGNRLVLHFFGDGVAAVDLVVIAAGVRPRTELARQAGLSRCPSGGVIVDDSLQTSDPCISAIGDCASHRSGLFGLVAPGYEMADVLASRLTGVPSTFRGATMSTRLKLLGIDVATVGEPLDRGLAVRFRSSGVYRLLRVDRGRLVGALGVGEWPDFGRIQNAAARRVRVWPWQIARFERTGRFWRTNDDWPVVEWPTDAVVCNCLNVTRGQIAAATPASACTAESVIERTGASTLCGSCRPLLEQLVGSAVRPATPISAGLLSASIAAVAAAIATLLMAPIPFALSSTDPLPLDQLWRDGVYRQISGFTLVGVALLASSLALRKRWRRVVAVGGFATWRVVHVLIGIATLVLLLVHTGGRLGQNLNAVLMTCFAALNVLGGLSGALTAVEPKMGRRYCRAWRAALVTAHVVAIWPLPVLIAFHVLSVYYF
jgi:nitrite reductase (NADH) large subunit